VYSFNDIGCLASLLEFPFDQVEWEADECKDDSKAGQQSHRVKSSRSYGVYAVLQKPRARQR
jgi:hypothetical protein